MATYLQLVQRVRQETGTAGTGPTTVENQKGQLAQLVTWVAQAYLDILNLWHDWKFLWAEDTVTCVVDQTDYTLAANLRRINEDAVYLTGGSLGIDKQPVGYIEYDQYRRNKGWYAGSGTPAHFTIKPDGKLRLLPAPDDTYTVEYEYWKTPTPLAGNTDNPAFAANYDDVIVWKAVMYWAGFNEAEAEFQKANFHFENAKSALEAKYLPAMEQFNGRSEGVDIVVRPE